MLIVIAFKYELEGDMASLSFLTCTMGIVVLTISHGYGEYWIEKKTYRVLKKGLAYSQCSINGFGELLHILWQ